MVTWASCIATLISVSCIVSHAPAEKVEHSNHIGDCASVIGDNHLLLVDRLQNLSLLSDVPPPAVTLVGDAGRSAAFAEYPCLIPVLFSGKLDTCKLVNAGDERRYCEVGFSIWVSSPVVCFRVISEISSVTLSFASSRIAADSDCSTGGADGVRA